MQKKLKWGALVLLVITLLSVISCNPFSGKSNVLSQQLAKATRGDVTANVSGSGNIQFVEEMKLTFGVGGKVDKILVKEGDEVNKGQALAKLETDTLELALTEAEATRAKVEVAMHQAELAVNQSQLAIIQAGINVEKAKIAQYQAIVFHWPEVAVAQADVDKAKLSLDYADKRLADAPAAEKAYWSKLALVAEEDLVRALDRLNVLLYGTPTDEIVIRRRELEAAERSLELAKQSAVLAEQALVPAEQSVKLTELSVKQAQKQLNEATITAPYAGIITDVYADEGDIIPPGTGKTIIRMVDPASMELQVRIDELDIAGVKLAQSATISVDALSDFRLEGKVSYISLMPTEEAGVVGYEVKVSFTVPEEVGLRSGMSASADIITAEAKNALLIPDRAIKRDNQGKTTVEVMVNGQSETRAVITGVSDGLQTEIKEGLKEGEQVIEKRASTNSSDASGLFGG